MASGKEIKRRIKSVKNTQQISKAMQMVSAAKMRKAQHRTESARPYNAKIRELIAHLTHRNPEYRHTMMTPRANVKNIAVIVITTDRGLCGGLNSSMLKVVTKFATEAQANVSFLTIGRKGRDFLARFNREIKADITAIGDAPALTSILPISTTAIDGFISGEFDEVYVAYSYFRSVIAQIPTMEKILPIELKEGEEKEHNWDYLYEPEAKEVLDSLLPRYFESIVYQGVLENISCEHSARMVAMKNATDNAKGLVKELTVSYNKARQAAITKELIEIVSGSAAVK